MRLRCGSFTRVTLVRSADDFFAVFGNPRAPVCCFCRGRGPGVTRVGWSDRFLMTAAPLHSYGHTYPATDFWLLDRAKPLALACSGTWGFTAGSGRADAATRSTGGAYRRRDALLPQLDFIQEFGFVLRGLQPKIDPSCIATILLLPHQRPESQLCAGIVPAVHNGPWSVIAWPLAIGLLRISVAPSV
jgi:hypothetical protein